mmetsp:Transcript_30032/g.77641  ORF Transcript_30032/g.77641 Transcript_30032/m.77641 type:complete len:254 (-) Transcript_30032:37-798(-)
MLPCSSTACGSCARPKRIFSRCARCLVLANTMVWPATKEREQMASSTASLASASPLVPLRRTTSCRSCLGAAPTVSAASRMGCRRLSAASRFTSSVIVAENSSVCRLAGAMRTISFTSSANPISSRRSASSSTRVARSSRWKDWLLRRWSISRPGVATTISGAERSVAACTASERPPTTSATRVSVNWPRRSTMECTCTASSRVGARISTAGPPAGVAPMLACSAGSRKPSVLPEPVLATAMRSAPEMAIGHA